MCGLKNGANGSKNKHFCRKIKRFCKKYCFNKYISYYNGERL